MVILSRKCSDANCNRLIIWSQEDNAFVNVDDRQLHKLSCPWMPFQTQHNNGNGKQLGELVLISSNDFDQAMKSIDEQFKSTQLAVSRTNALCMELKAKIDYLCRT